MLQRWQPTNRKYIDVQIYVKQWNNGVPRDDPESWVKRITCSRFFLYRFFFLCQCQQWIVSMNALRSLSFILLISLCSLIHMFLISCIAILVRFAFSSVSSYSHCDCIAVIEYQYNNKNRIAISHCHSHIFALFRLLSFSLTLAISLSLIHQHHHSFFFCRLRRWMRFVACIKSKCRSLYFLLHFIVS